MKRILYLGTDPTQFESQGHCHGHLIHYPVIKILPRPLDDPEIRQAYDDLDEYTHLLFTSKNAVKIFCQHIEELQKPLNTFKTQTLIAIGEVTAAHLSSQGLAPQLVSREETQEGVVKMLNRIDLQNAYVFMPRSTLSRPILSNYFQEQQIRYQACDLYDTVTQNLDPKPDLAEIDEIVFTSPSTVRAFLEIFGKLPLGKKFFAIGPITEESLRSCTKT
jgi:uroporphyrinogen-III synthase